MIDRVSLIAQLANLKETYAPTGETIATLVAHFQASLDNKELTYLEEDGQVVAFCDWSWIGKPGDIEQVNRGEYTTGNILHIINLVCTRPGLLRKLKGMLPYHSLISGERNGAFHTPKGLPQLVEA